MVGRIGIYEIFANSAAIQNMIVEGSDVIQLQRQAIKEGMRPLRLSGAEKVAAGITTIEEVMRVAPERIDL